MEISFKRLLNIQIVSVFLDFSVRAWWRDVQLKITLLLQFVISNKVKASQPIALPLFFPLLGEYKTEKIKLF